MTHWTDLRLRRIHQRLEALEAALAQREPRNQCGETCERAKLCATCAQALAQQDKPVQEPVAWSGYDLDGMVEALSRVVEAHYQRANPFQNPIYMDAQMALRILRGFIPAMKAYTAPPQRQPLTEEEINALELPPSGTATVRDLVRLIERAHGIGETK